ncbi:MAG: hypothetical protein MI723_19490 [Caulobacterales bacterium]|nr:hypothetical protein [Caulobacterales bacterium]
MSNRVPGVAVCLAASVSAPAFGRDDAAPNADDASEADVIALTGAKQNLSLQKSETSVELSDARRIEREVLFSIDDVLLREANVTVGTRYDWEGFRDSGRQGAVETDPPICVVTLPTGPLPHGGVTYSFDEDRSISLSVQRGYRLGNANIRAFANNLFDEHFVTRKDFAAVNTTTGGLDVRSNARFEVNDPRLAGVGIEVAF